MESAPRIPWRVHFGSFVLDRQTGALSKEGRAVKLAPQPSKLLSLLVSHAGEVVTREEIQKTLWPDDTFVDFDQGISFCVKQIREVLGDDAARPRYLATVPRIGYRFVAEVKFLETPRRGRSRKSLVAAAAALFGFGAFAVSYRDIDHEKTRPRVSVAAFENRTGVPELDWLRLGVKEMLTTELAESRDIEVSGHDAVADTVVRGSFVRAGERIRIDAHIEEGTTGNIVGSEKVEGEIETELFSMMEELTRRVRLRLEISALGQDPDLASMTTSSVDAYRYYIEGLDRLHRGVLREAIPYFEEALRIDPEFAMAIVNLAATYGLIGTAAEHGRWEESPEAVNDYWERRRELTERAFALSPRLPGRERFYIEGQHYRMQGEDARAIEAYEKAIDLHPDHLLARLSLASRYVTHHQFQDAIEQLEAIRSRTGAFRVGSTRADFLERPLAESYASLGRIDESFRILEEFVERFPEDPRGHEALGEHLVMTGRLDEALAGFERAQRLRDDGSVPTGMVIVHVVREEWAQAEVAARDNLFYRAVTRLYRGRSGEAVQLLTSLAEYERRDYLSETLLQLDRPSEILEFEGEPVLRAIALARLGRIEEAESEAKPFQGAQTPLARLYQHLFLFDLAKSRGDPVKGSEELGQAERLLAPRGRFRDEHPMHVPVWYRLACTHLEAGQLADAEEWFQKIVDSTTERVVWPIPYVRSLYLLGQIHEKRGELAAASRFYRRFYERWKDGDLDRDWVAHARTRSGI